MHISHWVTNTILYTRMSIAFSTTVHYAHLHFIEFDHHDWKHSNNTGQKNINRWNSALVGRNYWPGCCTLSEAEKRRPCRKEGRKHGALHPQEPVRFITNIRDGEVGAGEGGVRNFISNTSSLHCHHQNDSAYVSLIVWAKSQDCP